MKFCIEFDFSVLKWKIIMNLLITHFILLDEIQLAIYNVQAKTRNELKPFQT